MTTRSLCRFIDVVVACQWWAWNINKKRSISKNVVVSYVATFIQFNYKSNIGEKIRMNLHLQLVVSQLDCVDDYNYFTNNQPPIGIDWFISWQKRIHSAIICDSTAGIEVNCLVLRVLNFAYQWVCCVGFSWVACHWTVIKPCYWVYLRF